MTTAREPFSVIPMDAEVLRGLQEDSYLAVRNKISRLLIDYALIDSYRKFRNSRLDYPFVPAASMRPGSMAPSREYALQNSVLVILINGELPEKLRKHFRCREGNLVRKSHLAEVAPDLPGLDDFQHPQRFTHHECFGNLLRKLLPLDYALVIQKTPCKDGVKHHFELTHFHVKIERLMDNALRALGVQLNYLERGLYERGEDFIDVLEKKFFEYFNFYHNAAGRRSAAALAAQLLAREGLQGTVFVSSQQTRRLSILTNTAEHTDIHIEQNILVDLDRETLRELKAWGKKQNLSIRRHFVVDRKPKSGVMIFRAEYEHTEAGRPAPDGRLRDGINPREKWVRLREESLVPISANETSRIAYPLIYRRLASEPV